LLRVLFHPSLWPTSYLQPDFRQLSKNSFAALLPLSGMCTFFVVKYSFLAKFLNLTKEVSNVTLVDKTLWGTARDVKCNWEQKWKIKNVGRY
jgi:hypothetical protein